MTVPGGCSITSEMLVTVSLGFTPVQLPFGHPAAVPDTVGAAVSVFGLVVNVRFPFLTSPLGISVRVVDGPSRTLF
jgi:hypothetical protein